MAELSISRKNISKLFTDMQGKKFFIPEYQRPYKWDMEKCDTLWVDITNFHDTKKTENEEYFLGTIVSCKRENKDDKNIDIIDGQQRITSFFLLLRAFYKKLEAMTEDAKVRGLKNQIAPWIWDTDSISQEVTDKKKINIESLVATEDDKAIFHTILETGNIAPVFKDIYSSNYDFFLKKCNEYAERNPMEWQPLCVTILQKCIILPIECDETETALTIFTTLNDRGMPLADSDIFKAQIFKSKPDAKAKKDFTTDWKELLSTCKSANISLDDVFRYYSHVIRAKNNDKSKEVGLRRFYAGEDNKYSKLKEADLVNNLATLCNFWVYVNTNKKEDEIEYEISEDSKKYLHCLSCYPNEYWKYITSVFFLKQKNDADFSNKFTAFLKNLTAFLLFKFIYKPTVNAIKDDIYQGYINIQKNGDSMYSETIDIDNLKIVMGTLSSSKLSRALILLHSYLNANQTILLPKTFDIEHIFPKKWQSANYNGWNESAAQEYLEKFGNKVAFEKKLNIQAGNGYFGKKKEKYIKSKIQDVLNLGNYPDNDWLKDDIEQREAKFLDTLATYFEANLTPVGGIGNVDGQ
jgi:uncharacterized protein with ParB-like and HNH nuclease domain